MMKKFHWKKKKTIAMLINRKQWQRDYVPSVPSTSSEIEIEMEHLSGYYLITQAPSSASPNYIITE